ncbi:YggT family protein [Tepidibacillus fermentans]|uniref:YggT family protein n=1 Tax=Tepidibacillus fermentans TaxID=1281767 RepID=A0A4R3KKY9_9BACI|nr:YggT family protein [Tepidibacillus fermentans]TCS84397.1 YggT family protein [Tepidibacillus fermentans]
MISLLTQIIQFAYNIYFYMIFVYILMSWIPQMAQSPIGELLARLVEPYLRPFRRFIPPIGMIDISPIVAIFALKFIYLGALSILNYIFVLTR